MFKPGVSGNPKGRPKGTYGGRTQVLHLLHALVARPQNLEALRRAMMAEHKKDPVRFFKTVIMPLLPANAGRPAVSGQLDLQPVPSGKGPQQGEVQP